MNPNETFGGCHIKRLLNFHDTVMADAVLLRVIQNDKVNSNDEMEVHNLISDIA